MLIPLIELGNSQYVRADRIVAILPVPIDMELHAREHELPLPRCCVVAEWASGAQMLACSDSAETILQRLAAAT